MKACGIYKIVNNSNGKYYVGSSSDIEGNRWIDHKSALRNGTHKNSHLQNAWNKYGEHNFGFHIVENTTKDNLLKLEQKYLDIAKNEKEKCYNQTFLAGKVEFTDDLRKRLSEVHKRRLIIKENHNMYGRHHTEESKMKMSSSHKGNKLSLSARLKISGLNSVAHRDDVKKKKSDWWKELKKNEEEYKKFCKERSKRSLASRLCNKRNKNEEVYEITKA